MDFSQEMAYFAHSFKTLLISKFHIYLHREAHPLHILCVYHWLVSLEEKLAKVGTVKFCGDFEEMSWKCSVFINLYADSRGF